MKEHILAVQQMQDYIQEHVNEEITLADLAKVSLFSPWYSYRLFTKYTNLTPAEYIRKIRLSMSTKALKREDNRVIDVAYSLGFKSVDGYQRAFYREFGCNPGEYANHPVPIQLFIPYSVKFKETKEEVSEMTNIQNVFIQIIHKPKRKVFIKRGINADDYFSYCDEVGCDIWGLLSSMDSLSGEPVSLWLPEKYKKPNTSTYVQGVEVPMDYAGVIPQGFDTVTLSDADYLMFQGEPFKEEDYEEAIIAVQTAMDKYDPSVLGYKWDDSNPRIQLEPKGERGYIELRAVISK